MEVRNLAKAYLAVLLAAAFEYAYIFHLRPYGRRADYAALSLVVVYLIQRLLLKAPAGALGLSDRLRVVRRDFLFGAGAGLVLAVAAIAASMAVGGLRVDMDGRGIYELMQRFTFVKRVAAALLVAFGVELVYRGLIFSALSAVHSASVALVVSSLPYALSAVTLRYFSPWLFVNMFLLGFVLCLLRRYRGGLFAAIGAQAAWQWAFIAGQPIFRAQTSDFAVVMPATCAPLAVAAGLAWWLEARRLKRAAATPQGA